MNARAILGQVALLAPSHRPHPLSTCVGPRCLQESSWRLRPRHSRDGPGCGQAPGQVRHGVKPGRLSSGSPWDLFIQSARGGLPWLSSAKLAPGSWFARLASAADGRIGMGLQVRKSILCKPPS